jgi:hypothetical protein
MTAHDWYVENRIGLVARTLDRKEERTFRDHLSRCAECRAAIAELELDLAWLPMGARPVAPPPGLTRQLTERALRGRARWWRWAGPLAAAVAVLALAGWTDAQRQVTALTAELAARDSRLVGVQDSLSSILGAERLLQQTIPGKGHAGGVVLFYDEDTGRWNVAIHDLPPIQDGQVYRLWFLTERGVLPGPVLRSQGSRPTFVTLASRRDVVAAKLTLEPVDGRMDRPRGAVLAYLEF